MTVTQPQLRLVMSHYGNGRDALIEIGGELDRHNALALREAVVAALGERPQRVYLDFTDVSFIDSSSLSALAGSYKRATHQGCELILCAPAPSVRRVLDLTGISAYVTIQD